NNALTYPIGDLGRVFLIARQSVRMPGDDAVDLTSVDLFNNRRKDWSLAWLEGAGALLSKIYDPEVREHLASLADLGLDRQDLPLFAFSGLTNIHDVSKSSLCHDLQTPLLCHYITASTLLSS